MIKTRVLESVRSTAGGISLRGGRESTAEEIYYGPYMHDFYDLQYCGDGCFDIYINDIHYEIRKGQLFCVPPYVKVEKHFPVQKTASVFVCAKGAEMEQYMEALGFSMGNLIFPQEVPESVVEKMNRLVDSVELARSVAITQKGSKSTSEFMFNEGFQDSFSGYLQRTGLFYMMLSELMKLQGDAIDMENSKTPGRRYVEKAIRYMETNYPYSISVDSISLHVGINRSYLYTLFREEVGMSIQEFLIRIRMRAACEFLQQGDVQIKTVAASVGYEPVAFAHVFKKMMGISAQEYRAECQKVY